jgi:hypothetical protein
LPDLPQLPFAAGKRNPSTHCDARLKSLIFKEKFDGPNTAGASTIFPAAV